MFLKSNDKCPSKRWKRTHRGTQGEGHGKTEPETGPMQPQAKECLEPSEAGRGREEPFPGDLEGEWPPDSWENKFLLF